MVWVGYRRDEAVAREIVADPDLVDELLDSDGPGSLDLDKAWHGLHWLLTGSVDLTDDLASQALLGGDPLGEDVGYGPVRLLAPDTVAAVARLLDGTDVAALRARMDPAEMDRAGVYPGVWDEPDVLESFLAPALDQLRTFYARASAEGQAVIQAVV